MHIYNENRTDLEFDIILILRTQRIYIVQQFAKLIGNAKISQCKS